MTNQYHSTLDAPEYNAGDDFHQLWAVRKTLELINTNPSALKAITLEGIHPDDSPCTPTQAIDLLYKLKKDKTIWKRLHLEKNVSWSSLAQTFYDNYMMSVKLCIHASMDENALE
ncbi:hypothetical protein [uncultured Odoribacter sp.]|uniref:hypothetical protein n=1 Tax=uncultured Odoribacter sp. TaxID=876416 RepID=UPI0026353BEE|nr:hypothetical protein [uncultured Odoribacter sp.]